MDQIVGERLCQGQSRGFEMRCVVAADPVSGTPMVIPIGRHHGESQRETA
ncbi:hypothetical protein [Nonomuraea sp. NPDC046570]